MKFLSKRTWALVAIMAAVPLLAMATPAAADLSPQGGVVSGVVRSSGVPLLLPVVLNGGNQCALPGGVARGLLSSFLFFSSTLDGVFSAGDQADPLPPHVVVVGS